MKFGERLKAARTQLNLTQEMVAQELFVSRQTISSWENERSYPDIESLIKLSDYYQLSLDILLKEDNGMVEEIRKKEELAKINRIWGASYAINLILLFLLLLNLFSKLPMFEMGSGVRMAVVAIVLLNVILLMYVTNEKDKLSEKECRTRKYMPIVMMALGGLSGVAIIVGLILMRSDNHLGTYIIGMGAGGLSASLVMWFITKRFNKIKSV